MLPAAAVRGIYNSARYSLSGDRVSSSRRGMEKKKVLHFPYSDSSGILSPVTGFPLPGEGWRRRRCSISLIRIAAVFSLSGDRVSSSRRGMEKKKVLPFPSSDCGGILSLR
jgi:hypothetical protein